MRIATLTFLLVSLLSSSAWALPGGGGKGGNTKYAYLNIVNSADAAVDVSVNGGSPFSLEPLETSSWAFRISNGNKIDVTLTAVLTASPSVTATRTATIQGGKTATATIASPTSSTLAITFSGQGLAANFGRESGVMLASSGGLLPLVWFSFLLGRKPRRRPLDRKGEINSTIVFAAAP
jgi:hypothetical protein